MINRKPDNRFGIFPGFTQCFGILMIAFIAIFITHLFADIYFYEWYYARLWHQDRSSIFYHTTGIGKSSWMLWVSGIILVFMSFFRFPGATSVFLVRWNDLLLKVYFFFTAIVFSGILTAVLKFIIGRARPRATLPEHDLWHSISFMGTTDYSSMPSGHSTSIAALCTVAFLLMPRLGLVLIPLALWIGSTRLMVGAHFPSDVVAGLFLGVLATWLHARNFARKRLLFEFSKTGRLQLRNTWAKQAKRKLRYNASISK